MPITAYHVATATSPDQPGVEINSNQWNSAHAVTLALAGNEIIGAFSNTGDISFSTAADSAVYGIFPGKSDYLTSQTQQPMYFSASGTNTSASTLQFGNTNGVSFGLSNGSVIATVATNYQSQGAYLTTAALSGDTSKYAGTGYTSTTQAGTTVGVTHNTQGLSVAWPPFITVGGAGGGVGIADSAATITNNNVVFANSNKLSFGLNGSTMTASFDPVNIGMSALGNTAGTTGTFDGGGLQYIFAGGNNITLSQSSSANAGYNSVSLTISAANQSVQPVAVSGTNGSYNFSTLNFVTGNGASFYTDASGVRLSYSVPNVPAQSVQPVAASGSNGSFNFSTLQFVTGNGASFYTDATGIRLSYTVPSQTVQPVAASGSNGSFNFSTLQFVTGNGASFYTDATGIRLSYTVPTQTNQSAIKAFGVAGTTGTAGNTGLSTGIDWAIAGSNSITVSGSTAAGAATAWIQHPAWITGAASFSSSGNYNTTGSNNITNGVYYLAGGANITIQQNNNSISISGAAPGGTTFWTGSNWRNVDFVQGTSSFSINSNAVHVQPFQVLYPISFSYIRIPGSFGNLTSTTVAYTSGSRSFYYYQTINAVLYSQGAGANSRSLQQFASSYAAFTEAFYFSVSNAGTNESIAYAITYPLEGNNTDNYGSTMLTTAAGASIFLHTTGGMTNFSGIHHLDIPFASSLPPGNFWIALNRSTNTTTSGGGIAITGNVNRAHSLVNVTQVNSNFVPLGYASSGGATGSTQPNWQIGLGSHTVSAQGATTGSLALSSISSVANFPIIPMQFIRQA